MLIPTSGHSPPLYPSLLAHSVSLSSDPSTPTTPSPMCGSRAAPPCYCEQEPRVAKVCPLDFHQGQCSTDLLARINSESHQQAARQSGIFNWYWSTSIQGHSFLLGMVLGALLVVLLLCCIARWRQVNRWDQWKLALRQRAAGLPWGSWGTPAAPPQPTDPFMSGAPPSRAAALTWGPHSPL